MTATPKIAPWSQLEALMSLRGGMTPDPDWTAWLEAIPLLRPLAECPQDPIFHAEGDVWTHTKQVVVSLLQMPDYARQSYEVQQALFLSALGHDIAKPSCTTTDTDGRVRSPGHARRGASMLRELLYLAGAPFCVRELCCSLVRHHALPLVLLKKESRQLERRLYAASQTVSGEELAILAEADVRGRQCPDQQALLDEVALFRELCCAHECFVGPREFANAHSRFAYFRAPHRDASYEAYDDTRGEVVVLSGLPGVGKDHFIDVRRNTLGEVISLDAIRRQIGAPPSGEPGRVIDLARQRARELLRAGAAFCWNATNLTRDLRSRIIDLATDYGFSTRIVYLEVPWLQLLEQNAAREHAVPQAVLRKMLRRLEPPDLTEAYNIEARVSSSHHGDRQDSDSDNE